MPVQNDNLSNEDLVALRHVAAQLEEAGDPRAQKVHAFIAAQGRAILKPDEGRGRLAKLWEGANKGLIPEQFFTRALSGMTQEQIDEEMQPRADETPAEAGFRAWLKGSTESTARAGSSLTSPLSLGTFGAGKVAALPRTLRAMSPALAAARPVRAAATTARAVTGAASVGFGGKGLADVAEAGLETTPEAWEKRLMGAGMAAGGAAGAIESGVPQAGAAAGRATADLARRGTARVMQAVGASDPPPLQLITKAVKPRNMNQGWDQHIEIAAPDMKAAEAEIGRPIRTFDDALEAVKTSKQGIWAEYESHLGPHQQAEIDGNAIADAMMRSIDRRMAVQNPKLSERIAEVADTYRRPMTLAEAEEFLQSANRELHSYYAKNKVGRRAALADPEKAYTVAEAEALRDQLYSKLDEMTGPGAAELKRRYGALSSVEGEFLKQKNVYARQQPDSLAEQISSAHGYGKMVGGVFTASPGRFMEGAETVLRARTLKRWNSAEAMLERAFAQIEPSAPSGYQPRQWQEPAGLLGPGPVITPPPVDTSSVHGVPGEYARREVRGLLPRGSIITPPPAPRGEISVTSERWAQMGPTERLMAKSGIVRDPTTRKMVRQRPIDKGSSPGVESPRGEGQRGTAVQGTEVPAAVRSNPPSATGATTRVKVPGETRDYGATYQVRELADVQASHSAETFQPNERYVLKNDRNYGNAANQEKIIRWSQAEFDPSYHITDNPDATNGPVVIDSGGNAIGGNGRTMILSRVYRYNPRGVQSYRALLEQKAPQFGIDPATVRGMKQPVLVRVVDDAEFGDLVGKQDAITNFNKKGTAELTPAERAIADSRRISQQTLEDVSSLLEAEGMDATLGDILRGRQGLGILNALIEDGILTPQERAAYASGAGLTPAGTDRISKLLLARFFRDPAQIDSTPTAIRNKLERLIAPAAKAEGVEGWGLTDTIQESIDLLEEARTHGMKVDDLLRQKGLFGESARYSSEAIEIAKHLQNTTVTKWVKALREYAQDATYASKPVLFGNAPTRQESLNRMLEELRR